jgi:hypothetical protein
VRHRSFSSTGQAHPRTAIVPVAVILVLGLAHSTPAAAQVGVVEGRVIDDASEEPVGSAQVELLDRRERRQGGVLADESGRFTFRSLQPGEYRLRSTRIGYATVTTPVFRVPGDTLFVEVRMDVEAVLLAPLEVVSGPYLRRHSPGLDGFYYRMERGMGGVFITRDEIERRSPRKLGEVLVGVPNLNVSVGAGRSTSVQSRRVPVRMPWGAGASARACPPAIYLDGMRQPDNVVGYLDEISPHHVEGIEIYTSTAQVPGEFSGSTAMCGVIAIWTRRGPPRD